MENSRGQIGRRDEENQMGGAVKRKGIRRRNNEDRGIEGPKASIGKGRKERTRDRLERNRKGGEGKLTLL